MEHYYEKITTESDWFTYPNFYRDMVKKVNSGSHFVEVGCWRGRSSVFMAVEIINSKKDIKFDCIDPFYFEKYYKEGLNQYQQNPYYVDNYELNEVYEEFLNNIDPVKHVINHIKDFSTIASKTYKNNSIDFVFLDGNHLYKSVVADIEHWLPKIKIGGILSGHDYWDEGHYMYQEGVNKAVTEKFKDEFTVTNEGCWYINKNKNNTFKLL
jgi:hypothetical protein